MFRYIRQLCLDRCCPSLKELYVSYCGIWGCDYDWPHMRKSAPPLFRLRAPNLIQCCNRESTHMHIRTIVLACHTDQPCAFSLRSCSNSTDTAALGYLHLLLRCEGEIRFIQILPFLKLLASSDKLHFFIYFGEDAWSNCT